MTPTSMRVTKPQRPGPIQFLRPDPVVLAHTDQWIYALSVAHAVITWQCDNGDYHDVHVVDGLYRCGVCGWPASWERSFEGWNVARPYIMQEQP